MDAPPQTVVSQKPDNREMLENEKSKYDNEDVVDIKEDFQITKEGRIYNWMGSALAQYGPGTLISPDPHTFVR